MNRDNYPDYMVDLYEKLQKEYGFHQTLASEVVSSNNKSSIETITKFLKYYGRYIRQKGE